MLRSYFGRAVALGAVVGWAATMSIIAAEPSAVEDVLQGRGLVRSGPFVVLREDSDAALKARLGEVRALKERWDSARTRLHVGLTAKQTIQEMDAEAAVVVHTRNEYQARIDYIEWNEWRATRVGSLNSVQFAELRGLEARATPANPG